MVLIFGTGVDAGRFVAAFTAATTADPIDEVRQGMEHVERGDYDVSVPVFDASELGLLQAGFNTMAVGLRERERLRDLFGRHVGRDVARLAEESASMDGAPTEMGGANCEVAVLFVDVVGSTGWQPFRRTNSSRCSMTSSRWWSTSSNSTGAL